MTDSVGRMMKGVALAAILDFLATNAALALDPTNVRLSADDTGSSATDGVTYDGTPTFSWNAPTGGVIKYQWAVTSSSSHPSTGTRLREGFVTSTSAGFSNPLTDGTYKFWVQAEGPGPGQWGTWVASSPSPFQIDTVDPTTPAGLTNPGGATAVSDTTPNVTWSASSGTGSGIWTYDVEFSGPATHVFHSGDTSLDNIDFGSTTLASGAWTWRVRAIDVAGNDGAWSGSRALSVDTVAPTTPTGLTNPGGLSLTADNKPNVTWNASTDGGSGIQKYELQFQGPSTQNLSSVNTTLDDAEFGSALADGSWTWRARAVDNAGNASAWSGTLALGVDTQGPGAPGSLRMTAATDTMGASSSDGITYIAAPQFSWTKPADVGPGGTRDYYQWAVTSSTSDPITGTRLQQGFVNTPTVAIASIANGLYKFWVQAQDNVNNWGIWGPVLFRVDSVSPSSPGTPSNPGGAGSTFDTTPNGTWSPSTDGGSGIWTYDVEFTGPGNYLLHSGDTILDDVDFAGSSLAVGSWNWRVRGIDVAGNVGSWSSWTSLTVLSPNISLNPAAPDQTIDGFGGSFAMWGFGPDYYAVRLATQIEAGAGNPGLGATIVRVQGDEGGFLPGIGWNDGSTRWKEILRAARMAAAFPGVNNFILSFWYPPDLYCQPPSKNWNSTYNGSWASAIAVRANAFSSEIRAINPQATIYVSAQNEPNLTGNDIPYDGTWCYWTPAQMAAFGTTLRSALPAAMKIIAPELTGIEPWDHRIGSSNWSQYSSLSGFASSSLFDVVGFHIYDSYQGTDPSYGALHTKATALRTQLGTKKSWMTETTGAQWNTADWHSIGWQTRQDFQDPSGGVDRDLGAGFGVANYIQAALGSARSSAFLWWGLTYAHPDTISPVPTGNARQKFFDEGLIQVNESTSPMALMGVEKKFFAFRQYSAYVRPGAMRIAATTNGNGSLLALAFSRSSPNEIVVVAQNAEPLALQPAITGIPGGYTLRKVAITDATRNSAEILGTAWDGRLPAKSITTLIYASGSAAPTCTSFSLSRTSTSAGLEAGNLPITVLGSPAGCVGGSWSTSSGAAWISVTPPAGYGPSAAVITWTSNTGGPPRTGGAFIAGSSFQVSQIGIDPSDSTPPSVQVTQPTSNPTHTTTNASLNLGGVASDNIGVTQITWSNDRGGSGTAVGTTGWTVNGVALQAGQNILTVTARDAANNASTDTLTVTYDAPNASPTVEITQPTASSSYLTSSDSIALAGNAWDDVAVTLVTWASDRGGSGSATGTASWSVSNVALQIGTNVLTVTARDAPGSFAQDTLTVTYDPASVPLLSDGFESGNTSAWSESSGGGGNLTNLVGYWPFNSDTLDHSGNDNHGAWNAGGQLVPGKYGSASQFSQNQYFTIPSSPSLRTMNAFTLSSWFKPTSPPNSAGAEDLFGGGKDGAESRYALVIVPSDKTSLTAYNTDITPAQIATHSTIPSFLNNWHHLAVTWDGSSVGIYVEGQLVQTGNFAGTVSVPATSAFYLNRHNFGSTFSSRLTGLVDDVAVFSRALSAAEILQLATDSNLNGVADFWDGGVLP